MEYNKCFGANIRKYRLLNGLSIQNLSDRIHELFAEELSTNLISMWERGERNVSVAHTNMICKALGCTPNDLLPGYQSDIGDAFTRKYADLTSHARKIVSFAANQWHGNLPALVELNAMYMSMPPQMRASVALYMISTYEKLKSVGAVVDYGLDVNEEFVKTEWIGLLNLGGAALDENQIAAPE